MADIDQQVQALIRECGERARQALKHPLRVQMKTSYKDLVTNVDKENERRLDSELHRIDPGCRVLSEEGLGDQPTDLSGRVWIVDPIDGTMNFVLQHRNFAIMAARYIDGKPDRGYILDVMNDELCHGVIGHGVYVNGQRLTTPPDRSLTEGLIAVNVYMITHFDRLREVAVKARGVRMYGSAGIEMMSVLTGRLSGYISYLHPWDLAAGRVLATELKLPVQSIDDSELSVLSSNTVIVATKRVNEDIMNILH